MTKTLENTKTCIIILLSCIIIANLVQGTYIGAVTEGWLVPPFQEATYIIGQYNATHYYARNHTGYGGIEGYEWLSANDTEVIQSAIDSTNSTGGGTVYVKSGSYSATVTVKGNVLLVLEAQVTGVSFTVHDTGFCLQYTNGQTIMNNQLNMSHHDIVNGVFHLVNGSFPPNPVEGQFCYRVDIDSLWVYNGSAWERHGPESYNVTSPPTPPPPVLSTNTALYIWGLSKSTLTGASGPAIVNHMAGFDMVLTEFGITDNVSDIKALHADCIVLGYRDAMAMHTSYSDWAVVNANEAWFMHDTNNDRIVNKYWGWYAMNASQDGWVAHLSEWIDNRTDDYGFDGVLLDDTWTTWIDDEQYWTVDDALIPSQPSWETWMGSLIQNISDTLDGDELVIVQNDNWITQADGLSLENFMVNRGVWGSITTMEEWSGEDKITIAWNKHSSITSEGDEYGYCGYLLGVNGTKCYYAHEQYWATSQGYIDEMDIDTGEPTADYYQVSETNVWKRTFDNVTAYFNPSAYGYSVDGYYIEATSGEIH